MAAVLARGVDLPIAHVGQTNSALGRSLQRIASGQRVRQAADDPAGLAVAVNLRTTDLATWRAMKNMNDGVSRVHIARGAAGATVDVLQRMRELAMQGSAAPLASDDRSSVEDECGGLISEIDRVASEAQFDGTLLATGGRAGIVVHVGGGAGFAHRISVGLGDLRSSTLVAVDTTNVSNTTLAQTALDAVDTALGDANGGRSRLGASHNRPINALHHAETHRASLNAARSRHEDADMGHETARLVMQSLRQAGGVAAIRGGLRSLETSRGLLAQPRASGGGEGAGVGAGGRVPACQKGDFPEDLV
ncbi:MAG: flagellin [Myxococcota bacterium]|nr:flagellin [Myxococcota bacterium]